MNYLINFNPNINNNHLEDLLCGWQGLIQNLEHGMEEGEQDPKILRNLKEVQQVILQSIEKTKPSFKKNNKGELFKTNSKDPTKLKKIKFKVLKNKPKNGAFAVAWERHFKELVEFKKQNGHTNPTRSGDGEIGNWVAEQRRKLKNGKITKEQYDRLNSLGFEWDRKYYFYNTYPQPQQSNDNNQ